MLVIDHGNYNDDNDLEESISATCATLTLKRPMLMMMLIMMVAIKIRMKTELMMMMVPLRMVSTCATLRTCASTSSTLRIFSGSSFNAYRKSLFIDLHTIPHPRHDD